MGRPTKNTVDYFPHLVNHGKTIFILEEKFGNNGYSCWFKLLEELGKAEGHFLDINDKVQWFYLISKFKFGENGEEITREILNLLAAAGAIDEILYENGIIWCEKFVEGLKILYDKRVGGLPKKPCIPFQKPYHKDITDTETTENDVTVEKTHQSIVKYSKVEKHIVEQSDARPYMPVKKVVDYLNEKANSSFRHTSKDTKTKIRARFNEGFTLEDFFSVIDFKVEQWKNDPEYCIYLRPLTLFGTKFEGYLQAAKRAQKPAKGTWKTKD